MSKKKKQKPSKRIAFVMIHYPFALGRYMLEALMRRDDIELWTAGPFTGPWIPWAGGMHLREQYILKPDFAVALSSPPALQYGLLERNAPWEPDLWVEVNAGLNIMGPRPKAPIVLIQTDPHVLGNIYRQRRQHVDYSFCMQTPYMDKGDIWLPYAYDPVWHSPSEIGWEERRYDAALLGLHYAKRNALMDSLRRRGLKTFYNLGPVYAEAKAIYHDARLGINWSSMEDTNARVFELMAMGVCPIMNRVPDLMNMFEDGKHFLGFDNITEAASQAEKAIREPKGAQAIARAAQEAVREHTWDNRMAQVLEHVGLC